MKNIENLKEFKEGLFSVQDEAAGLTAVILNPQKQEKILVVILLKLLIMQELMHIMDFNILQQVET